MTDDTDDSDSIDTTAQSHDTDAGFTVTPYEVAGEVDYGKLLDRFGADPLTDSHVERFPDHPMVRRRIFYAGRDIETYLDAAEQGNGTNSETGSVTHSLVTGRGPSGPMHLGHVLPFYFVKRLQEATGATVYIPLSDDEKYFATDQSFAAINEHTRSNLREILAVGFDPERTRIVIDTADADVCYPIAATLADHLTQSTVDAVYGDPETIGLSFYPAMQATHLLLPQLVNGRHQTLVPIAVDQDPHVRVCRDIAAKERLPVTKPGALLSKFLPALEGPGKMSSSDDAPAIQLADSRETIREKIMRYAHSGGQSDIESHREQGGDPEVDVAYQYLYAFFEADDERLERIAADYRAGDLLSGELKDIAAEAIADFLESHQERKAALGSLGEALDPYRLTDDERQRALRAVGAELDLG